MPFISIILIIAAALFAAAFFYVSRIISSLPKGRAEEHLLSQDSSNKNLIACIGDSLTHGNIGQSWVDYLRKEFPNYISLQNQNLFDHEQGIQIQLQFHNPSL